ncbi:MAG: flagellar protein FliS [Alphaproteobacteria bacterium]
MVEHQNASSAYRTAYETNMSGMEIVAELYKGIIKNLEEAKRHYKAEKLDEMCNVNEKTNKILIALQSHLNMEEGGEASQFLNTFYNGIFAKLTRILSNDDVVAAYDEIIENVKPVYKIWCEHAANQAKPAS